MARDRRTLRRAAGILMSAAALAPGAAAAQAGWSGSVDASGSLLFGNASDQLLSGQLRIARADSSIEVQSDTRLTYGSARPNGSRRRVTARTAFASLGVDLNPFRRYSPFWFGSIESSLQQRIARRLSTGAGAKLTFHRRAEDEGSVSLALLAEHTAPRAAEDAGTVEAVWRSRWSIRGRIRKRLASALGLTHVTFYQPTVEDLRRYTIVSTTTLAVAVTGSIALTTTLQDTYDSDARARGARSNNDGQVLFGVRAEF